MTSLIKKYQSKIPKLTEWLVLYLVTEFLLRKLGFMRSEVFNYSEILIFVLSFVVLSDYAIVFGKAVIYALQGRFRNKQ